MAAVAKIADKTLTTILGASVAINGFFATRAFSMLDRIDGRVAVMETAEAVGARIDQYQDQRLDRNNERLLSLESWYSKAKKGQL